MNDKVFCGSLSRISDLETKPFDCEPVRRTLWRRGDYVLGEVTIARGGFAEIELCSGRLARPVSGDVVLGALGVRHATLEVVGSFEEVGKDGEMDLLGAAGLLGRATSVCGLLPSLIRVDYRGHAMRDGKALNMVDFAVRPAEQNSFRVPTILIVGTSMSAGKTTSAKIIIRELKRRGYRVAGAKLTGAGRYRDILAMRDAGADTIFDFVDVGLPSSVLTAEEYRERLRDLLGLIANAKPDVLVAEAGASPLEPYNGDTALEELGEAVVFTVLCASDPYAVVGVMHGFEMNPDLVAGLATSTIAGEELVRKLSGAKALNLLDRDSILELRKMLESALPGAGEL
jgi:hypothetical protein